MPEKMFCISSGAAPAIELVLSADRNFIVIRRGNDYSDHFEFASVLLPQLINTLEEVQREIEKGLYDMSAE